MLGDFTFRPFLLQDIALAPVRYWTVCWWRRVVDESFSAKALAKSAKMAGEKKFDLQDWCTAHSLDSATLEVLQKQKLTSEAALETLSREDCVALKLPMGQRNLLWAAVGATKQTSSTTQSQRQQL